MNYESHGYPLVKLIKETHNQLIFKTPKETSDVQKVLGICFMIFGVILLIAIFISGFDLKGFFCGIGALFFLYAGYNMYIVSRNLRYTLDKKKQTIEIIEEDPTKPQNKRVFSFNDITHFKIYKKRPKYGQNVRYYFDYVGYMTINNNDFEFAMFTERAKTRSMLNKLQKFTDKENITIDYNF